MENIKNNLQKTLDKQKKNLYNNTMMKTIHSFNQQPRLNSWLAGYCSEKNTSIDPIGKRLDEGVVYK